MSSAARASSPQAATLDQFRDARPRSDPGHRPVAGRGARRVRRLVSAAARLGHLGTAPTCWPSRSATRATASTSCRASARRSRACGRCSSRNGKARPRCSCRAATCRAQARCSPGPRWPTPTSGSAGEAVGATREARIDAARRAWYQGFVAEAVDRFCRDTDVLDVTGRHHRGLLRGDDFARWSATRGSAADLRLSRPHRAEMRTLEPGSGVPAAARIAARLRSSARWTRSAPSSSTPWWNAPSSPLPIARPITAIRILAACRSKRCCRTTTTRSGAVWSGEQASMELRPGEIPGYTSVVDHQAAEPRAVADGHAARVPASRPWRGLA